MSAQTTVLRVDTIWSGRVELSDDVTVAPGVTLLALPGTTVVVAKHWNADLKRGVLLDVRGRLVAQGRPDQPILFTSGADQPSRGDWAGIVFTRAKGGVSRLSQCRIEYAQAGIQGGVSEVVVEDSQLRRNRAGVAAYEEFKVTLSDCEVSENEKGLYFEGDGNGRVERCRIARNEGPGIEATHGSRPVIVACDISENDAAGVACVQGASPRIEGNVIRGNRRGVSIELMSKPEVVNNEILDNDVGVWAEKQVRPIVRGNLVARNRLGAYFNLDARPEFHGNDVLDNRDFAVALGDNMSWAAERVLPSRTPKRQPGGGTKEGRLAPTPRGPRDGAGEEGILDARGNWWGPAGTRELAEMNGKGNASLFDDGWDRPTVEYLGPDGERTGQQFPRDRVGFVPWAEAPTATTNPGAWAGSGIRGRVVRAEKPAEGVRVYAFGQGAEPIAGEGVAFSAPTGPDGAFFLRLLPGRYRLVARRMRAPLPLALNDVKGVSWLPLTVDPGSVAVVEVPCGESEP